MRVSFVLRLDADALAAGELSGDIEEVHTGHRGAVRGTGDVVDFCCTGREGVGARLHRRAHPTVVPRHGTD
ncbi:MAG: hypothetical protein JWO57_3667 [Pseudonocardiales bacterium]|nr:hypothetical protein [Pseudonocardiales bacterium]